MKHNRTPDNPIEFQTVTSQRKRRKVKKRVDYEEIEFKDLLVKDLDILVWYNGDQFWKAGYYAANIASWAYEEEFGLKRLRIGVKYSGGEDVSVNPSDIYEFGCRKKLTKENMGKHMFSSYVNGPKALEDDGKNDADYDDPKFRKGIDDKRVETIDRDDFEEERKELENRSKEEKLKFFQSGRNRKGTKKSIDGSKPQNQIIIPPPPIKAAEEVHSKKKKKKKKKKRKKGLMIILRRPTQK